MTPRGQRTIRNSIAIATEAIIAAALIGAVPATASASLYAVTDAGVAFESTNDGVTWVTKGQIQEPSVVSVSPGLTVGQLFALGASGSLYKSTDAGAAWSAVGNAGASDCVSLAIGRSGALLALTRSGDVLCSNDAGASWSRESNAGASDCVAIAVGGKIGGGDTLFVATSSGDIARLPNGTVWTTIGTTSFTPVVDLLWISSTLYALTDAGETLRSSNTGATWSAIGTISQVGMRDLAYVGGKFKAISKEGEVYESATGASWSSSWIGTTNQVFTVAFAPGVPEFLTGVESPSLPTASALRAWPNPFTERVEFRFDGAASVSGRAGDARDAAVEIFDTAGRRVASTIARIPAAAAKFSASWDGRLADGRRAPSGVYIARVQVGLFNDATRIVLLR